MKKLIIVLIALLTVSGCSQTVSSDAKISAEKEEIAFKVQRVESYQIVFSGHPNACEECESMADEHFNIADLKIGVTAPPFHPHCGCRR